MILILLAIFVVFAAAGFIASRVIRGTWSLLRRLPWWGWLTAVVAVTALAIL